MSLRWIPLIVVLLNVSVPQGRGAEPPVPRPNVERLFVSGETGYAIESLQSMSLPSRRYWPFAKVASKPLV